MSYKRRAFAVVAAAIALVALSACSDSNGDDDAGAPTGDRDAVPSGSGSQLDDAQALVFAECMRDNGVDMPDPGPGTQGFYDALHATLGTYAEATINQAVDACQDVMPQFAAEPHGGDDEAQLALAECLRDEGLDVPDNLFERGQVPDDIDRDELVAALEECRDVAGGSG